MRQMPKWHRAPVFVHRFQNHPVGVQVHAAVTALPAHGEELGGAEAVAYRTSQRPLDVPACRQTQRLAPGPDFARAKSQRTAFGLVGQQGRHRRIGGDHRRRVAVERSDQIRNRLHDREAAEIDAHPWIELTQSLDGHVAGEVAANGSHEGQTLIQVHRVGPTPKGQGGVAPQRFQRVVHRHAGSVLHEDAGLQAGAGTFPDDKTSEVGLTQALRIGGKRFQFVQAQPGIGHPVVKSRHQCRPGHRRQIVQWRARCEACQVVAVEPRPVYGGLKQSRQSRALPRCHPARRIAPRRQHIQRDRSEPQRVKHRNHGVMLGA